MAKIKRKRLLKRLEEVASLLDENQNLMKGVLGEDSKIYRGLYDARCVLEDIKEDVKEKEKL